MISEKQFAASHPGFWDALLPFAEPYVRTKNLNAKRFEASLVSINSPVDVALINEVAFELFILSDSMECQPGSLPEEVVRHAINNVVGYVGAFHQPAGPRPKLTKAGLQEAQRIARRLATFFAPHKPLTSRVGFPGCGWLDHAEGDVLSGSTLFEIKGGARTFRAVDYRQLLIYCALDFSSGSKAIDRICLLNPREGIYIEESVDVLCQRIAGAGAVDILADIVHYIAEPNSRYRIG